jgi:GT2 family glycosyltransferase
VNLTVSVVSHGQAALVSRLMEDLIALGTPGMELLLTVNVPEDLGMLPGATPFPVTVIRNDQRKGFGANHNAALARARGRFVAVVNPGVRLALDPFPALCAAAAEPGAGVVAPLVFSPEGDLEDSARRFPTLLSLLRRVVSGSHGPDYPIVGSRSSPDWVAGMFMVFPIESYRAVGGFDERYFLYYEDVDLCWRLRRSGRAITLMHDARIVHEARRDSHRRIGYLRHHLSGMGRFLWRSRFGLRRP